MLEWLCKVILYVILDIPPNWLTKKKSVPILLLKKVTPFDVQSVCWLTVSNNTFYRR
jgi:hypothetical protein